ncbi:hypothetical protein GIB67_020595 [Kingdonia uniflora]|nr:hypothetical protein GIB67_020595 [Kingdonia uniflora]
MRQEFEEKLEVEDSKRRRLEEKIGAFESCESRHGINMHHAFQSNASFSQEARGLDTGPRLVQKLIGFGDRRTSKIVAQIAYEEVAYMVVGIFWFYAVCQKLGRVPYDTFKDLLKEYNDELKGTFNYSARDIAGIPRDWYDPSFRDEPDKTEQLSKVYERLAYGISTEKDNSSLNDVLQKTEAIANAMWNEEQSEGSEESEEEVYMEVDKFGEDLSKYPGKSLPSLLLTINILFSKLEVSVGELNTIHQSESSGCADGNNLCYLQFEKLPVINQEGSQWIDCEISDVINMIYQNLHKLDSYLSLLVA